MPRTEARWGAGARLWEANLSILAWREAGIQSAAMSRHRAYLCCFPLIGSPA